MIRGFDATMENISQSCEIIIVRYCLNLGEFLFLPKQISEENLTEINLPFIQLENILRNESSYIGVKSK